MLEGISLKAILSALAVFGIAVVAWRGIVYFEDVGYQRAVNHYETLLSKAKAESLTKERELQAQKDEAIKKGAEREKQIKVEIAILDSTNRRLRNDIATFRARLPKDSGAACIAAANTAADVFGECSDRLVELAKTTDELANYATTCAEAWPK